MREEIVYYSYMNDDGQQHSVLYGEEPYPVKKGFVEGRDSREIRILQCPSFKEYINNVYQISSTHHIDFDVYEDRIASKTMPQIYFKRVTPHSSKERMYGVDSQSIVFVSELDSLEVSQEHPYLSDTKWSNSVNVLPGRIDIGKYFRTIALAFDIHKGVNNIKVNEGEPLYYLRFHTDKEIKFVRFVMNDTIKNLIKNFKFHGKGFHTWKPLSFYYEAIKNKKYKKFLMKQIKENALT